MPLCSIRQHTSAYVSIRQHTSAYVSIRQHTSAYLSEERTPVPLFLLLCTRMRLALPEHTPYIYICKYLYFCTSKASKLSTFQSTLASETNICTSGIHQAYVRHTSAYLPERVGIRHNQKEIRRGAVASSNQLHPYVRHTSGIRQAYVSIVRDPRGCLRKQQPTARMSASVFVLLYW